jgi:hypothetical protein
MPNIDTISPLISPFRRHFHASFAIAELSMIRRLILILSFILFHDIIAG